MEPTVEVLQQLERAFVEAYNQITSQQYCDPFQRRLVSAEVIKTTDLQAQTNGARQNDPYAIEMVVEGTCRGCDGGNITLYDSISVLRNISLTDNDNTNEVNGADDGGNSNRLLLENLDDMYFAAEKEDNEGYEDEYGFFSQQFVESEDDDDDDEEEGRRRELQDGATTCYCSVGSIPDQGPTEVEVIEAFGIVVDSLNLMNIESVGECRFLTVFQSSVILQFVGDAENATQSELDALGASFVDSYNRINAGDDVCDRQFRQLRDFRVEFNITINEEVRGRCHFSLDPSCSILVLVL